MFWQGNNPQPVGRPAREHHHEFARHVVRLACADDVFKFFDIMGTPERGDFVALLWRLTAQRVGTPIVGFDPNHVKVRPCMVKDMPAIIITMPPPVAATEAYFVGLVLTNLYCYADYPQGLRFRYFTLEQTASPHSVASTMLCEWVEGVYVNTGSSPAPSVKNFKAAMAAAISSDQHE